MRMGTTVKKGRSPTARKKPARSRRRTTPAAAAAAPASAALARHWYEHPLLSPVVWTVIAGALAAIWAFGEGLYRDFKDEIMWSAPQPFAGDRVGILLARLENDPGNEYASRVRSALERQFPISADGGASVEVNLFPKKLALPEHGRLSENIIQANAEGRQWLKEQKADLLIWGRALPSAKMLELRILTRDAQDKSPSAQPELYPIKIPSEFSEQIGGALAGMIAGAGANAWNQRGGYLSPGRAQELLDWMSRLKTLQSELPDSLDAETRTEIRTKIETARVQIGAALLADGSNPLAGQVLNDLFPSDGDDDDGILSSHPFLVAEIVADIVSQFTAEVGQIGEDLATSLTTLIKAASEKFDARRAEGAFEEVEYAYLSGLMHKLAGQVEALSGKREEAKESFAKASDQLKIVIKELSGTHDQLSRSRVQGYLGEVQLAAAQQYDADEAGALLDASIANFEAALTAVSPETAPRDAVRLRYFLATAELKRATWLIDAEALESSIQNLEDTLPLLAANRRYAEKTGTTMQLASLLVADAVYRSGVASAKKSLALLDDVGDQQGDKASEHCASMDGEQRTRCIEHHKAVATQETATIERSRCLAHLAAGHRFDRDGETLSAAASKHFELSRKACETAATAMMELGNTAGWAEAKLFIADGLGLSGERAKDVRPLREAAEIVEEVETKREVMDHAILKAQTALTAAGAARELGALSNDADLLRKAIGQQLAARNIYVGKEFAAQRLHADEQLARSLTDLAELQGTDEGLDEAIELLVSARDTYAAGGATLAAEEQSRELEKARALQAKLAAN